MERIGRRGRPFEKDMDRDYIKQLNEAYNYFFFHYVDAPLLVVNTNGIDFVNNPDDFEDLLHAHPVAPAGHGLLRAARAAGRPGRERGAGQGATPAAAGPRRPSSS